MPISQLLLDKIGQYESDGHDADSIVSGLSESQNFPDIAAKVKDYQSKGYTPEDILSGLKSSPVESQPSLIQKGLQAGKQALDTSGEYLGKSVIEPGMEAIGLKKYADVPAAFVRGATAGWVAPKTEAPAEPEGIGHTIAKEAAYLGGMAVPTKYIGMGLRGLGLLPKGAGIVARAVGGAETLGGYGAISAPEEGRTWTEKVMDDVIMGAAFGGAGGAIEKIASKVSPSVASLLEKRAIGLKAGKNITPEVAETLKLTPSEQAAAKMLPYITSTALGAGAGATEPAQDMGDRLRNILTGAGAFAVSHGVTDLAEKGFGLRRGVPTVEPQPQPETRTATGIEKAPITVEPEKVVEQVLVEPKKPAEQVTGETEQVISQAEKTVATKESGEAENPQEAIADEVELPASSKEGSKEPLKGKVYRVAPAEIPIDEVPDHWVTTSIEDAQKMRDRMQASGNTYEVTLKDGSKVTVGKKYNVYEIDTSKVNEARGESRGKSPYGTGAEWVETKTELKPDAVVGEVKAEETPAPEPGKAEEQPDQTPEISAKEKVTNVLKGYETHPNRTIAMAKQLDASPEEFEAMRKNIIEKGAPGTDKERELVRLIASGEYRNVRAEVKPEEKVPATPKTYTNTEEGIETRVSKHEKGFAVTTKDIESGEFLPTIKVYPTEERAIEEAKKIVGQTPKETKKEEAPVKEATPKVSFDKPVLEHMKSRIEMGKAGGVSGVNQEGERKRFESSYPQWFKNKGFTKDRALTAINKAIKGHPLTDKQEELISSLYEGAKGEHAKASKIYKEMDAERADIINEKKDGIELDPSKLKEGDSVIINGEKFTHKGFDKDGNIIIADSKDYRLDIGDKLMVDKVEKGEAEVIPGAKEEPILKAEEPEKPKHKPVQKDMFGVGGKTLEGPLPSKELGETPLESAAREAEGLKVEKEEQERQGKLEIDKPKKKPTKGEKTIDKMGLGTEEKVEEPAKGSPSANVAKWVVDKLSRGERITREDLIKQADAIWGGTRAEGKYNTKDMHDALEMGINQFILKSSPQAGLHHVEAAWHTIDLIRESIMDKIPSQQGIRTAEQNEFQQFSTPPDLAYTMAWLADIRKEDEVLEPSAGTGGLASFAKSSGAKTIVNELSERRAAILKEMGFDAVHTENAEQLDNILHDKVKPTVVLMNPPFSATAGRVAGQRDSANALKHLDAALNLLSPQGRLVALVGKGWFGETKSMQTWLSGLGKRGYALRAVMDVDGKGYAKYGTTYDTRILVIDKTSEKQDDIVRGSVNDVKDALPLLKGVRNDRPKISRKPEVTEQPPAEPGLGKVAKGGGGEAEQPIPERPATGDVGAGKRGKAGEGITATGGRVVEPTEGESAEGNVPTERLKPEEPVPGAGGVEGAGGINLEPGREETGDVGEVQSERTPGVEVPETETDVFAPHKTAPLTVKGAKPHQGDLEQSIAMASVSSPKLTYVPDIPDEVINAGDLSDAQLEAITLSGQAHEKMLKNQNRTGFFIGDGTGVGKGREIAGVIMDNWRRGRKKAIWFSVNNKLSKDALRDWNDVGMDSKLLKRYKESTDKPIPHKEAVLFSTYGALRSGISLGAGGKLEGKPGKFAKAGSKPRLERIVEWLGKDFDGVIVFDEAHKLKNATSFSGQGRMAKEASLTASAALELQNRLPKARVVYVSATGATEVANLAYAERLGLWGEGTAFPTRGDFLSKISSSGMAAMEAVARELKQMGLYISRSLSFKKVAYERAVHNLSEPQQATYNRLSEAWNSVINNIEAALDITDGVKDKRAKAFVTSQFWSAHQRFFNQVITSMQMPTVLADAEKRLAEGKSVVMQLVNTNQAPQDRAIGRMEEGDVLEDLDMTPREQLMEYVSKGFPTAQYETYTDENGNESVRIVLDSKGDVVHNQEALAMKNKLLKDLTNIKVPSGPLEQILDRFGADKVAEVTGRTRRVVWGVDEQGNRAKKIEPRGESHTEQDVIDFQGGKKRILVFSNAGGTGLSFHASLKAKNQQQRVHYLVQPGWEADVAVQGFGRTHRTNQASAPIYVLCTTDLKGQKRFISSIARRLGQLGALTKGERKAGTGGLFNESDNLESQYANDAKSSFFNDLLEDLMPGLDKKKIMGVMGIKLDPSGNVVQGSIPEMPRFLNRLLSLDINTQNAVFDEFSKRVDINIDRAKANGTYDQGIAMLKADKIVKKSEQRIYENKEINAATNHVTLEIHRKIKTVPFDSMERSFVNEKKDSMQGFYRNITSGRVSAVVDGYWRTDTETGEVFEEARVTGVNGRIRYVPISEIRTESSSRYIRGVYREVKANFEKLSKDQAQGLWNIEVENTPKHSVEDMHVITGSLLPIWDRLPGGFSQIYRIKTDKGETFLGRQVKDEDVDSTLTKLGASGRTYDTEKIFERMERGDGTILTLANDWRIVSSIVSGDKRIEIKGDLWPYRKELESKGAFSEEINWSERWFIPTGKEGAEVLKKIIEDKPIASVAKGGDSLSIAEGMEVETKKLPLGHIQVNRLMVDALRISAPGSEIELKRRIEIDRDSLSKALGKWSEGDMEAPFVIKGAHRTVELSGNRMASIMEFSLSNMDETTPHHEAFHSVQELLLKDKEREILDDKYPSKEGVSSHERQAEAFAQWVANKKKLLPLSIKEIFGKIMGFFERIGNSLRGLGFQNVEDIFGKAWRGEYRQRSITEASRREMGLSAQAGKIPDEEMKRLNVRFEGMQKLMEGNPIPLYTDLKTGSSFYLPEGKSVEQGIKEVRDRYGEVSFQISPAEDRILKHVSYGEKDTRTFGDKIKDWSSTAYTNFIDKLNPINRMVKEIAGKTELKAIEDPYKRFRLLAGSMVGKASSALEYKTIDFNTYKFNGEGLSTILKPVIESGELRNFTAYLASKRAIEKSGQGIETGIDVNDAQAVVNQSESKYGAKAQQLYDYNDRILQYYRDSGMISDGAYNAMKNRNMFYVPFYRAADKLSGMGKGSEAWQTIKKMKGAETDIVDPIESIVKNTYLLTGLAEKNDAMRSFVDFTQASGFGRNLVRKASPDTHMHTVSMKEMLKNEGLKDFLDELDSEGPELVSEQIKDEVANIFRPNMMKDPNTIVLFKNGKAEYYTIADESVAKAIKGVDRETMPLLIQVLSKPASWLRAGATLSPEFLMRNPVRDWFSAMAYSKYGFNPVKFFSGLKSSAVKDEVFWQWMVGGGSQSSFVSLDRQNLSKTSVELMRRAYLKGQIKNKEYREALKTIPKNPIEMLRILSELGEEGTRLAEFKSGIGREGETKEGLLESAFQSREVTLDFGRIGAKMKAVNMLISFFNANVQGMDKMIRNLNFRENPRLAMKTAMKAVMTMTIPSMLLAWATKDDKDIDEIPRWQKDIFWIVPVGEGKDKTFYRIPKPFELGTVFATIPERLMEYMKTHDTKSFDKIGDTIMNGAMPNMIPTFATPFMEAWANKSTFTGRPIVPKGKEELLPQYQYTHYTTDTAKRIAGLIGKIPGVGGTKAASPAQLENAMRGWAGNLGALALQTVDKALEGAGVKPKEVKPVGGLADIPGIRGFIARYPSGGAESIQRFYDNYERISEVRATYRGLLREGKAGEAQELLRGYEEGIPNLNTFHAVLGRLNKIRDRIYSNPSISPEEKKRLLDEIYYKMISVSRMANDAVERKTNNQ